MPGEVKGPVLRWLIFGHLWVALAVAAQIFQTTLFLREVGLARRYALAAFLGTFAAYGVTRLARLRAPETGQYINLRWYREHRVLMHVLVALASAAAFMLMWPLWPHIWKVLVPVVLLTFFYVTPFTTSKGRGIGLRTVPFIKALLIAVAWSVVAVAVPLMLDPEGHGAFTIAGLTCMRVPLILALAILFDVRDMYTDDPALRTVPLLLGVKGAKAVVLFLLLCSAGLEVLFLRTLGYHLAPWAVLGGYAVALALALAAKPHRDPFYYAILVDGVMILVPLCTALGVWLG